MNLSARLRKIAGPRPWGWQELREPSLTEWLAVAEHLDLKPNTNTRRMAPQLEEDYRDVRLQLHADAGHLANMYSRNSGLYSKIGGTLWKIFKPTAEAFLHAMASLGLPYQVVTEPKMATSYTARCVGVLGFYTQQQFEAIEAFARGKDAQALTDRIAYTLRDTLARDPTFTNMLREEPTIPGPPSE